MDEDTFRLHPADLDELLQDPTRCYVRGCTRENEILLHVSDEGFTDLCGPHAAATVTNSSFILGCDCTFCGRARKTFLPENKEANNG